MEEKRETVMKWTYLYNCGIVITYRETILLIDGIFEKDNEYFDKMPDPFEQALFYGETPFEKIDALLFTHCHADHYSRTMVERYTAAFPATQVISPETILMDEQGRIICGDFEITYIETGHIPTGIREGKHYVFEICAGEKRMVLTGDMDPEKLADIIRRFGTDADVFLVNPALLLYEMKRPEETLLRRIKNLYVYHIPSEARDVYGYRKAALSIMSRVEQHLGKVTLLLDNMMERVW